MDDYTSTRAVVADDDPVIRGVIRRLLENNGYVVVAEAAEPQEVVAAVEDAGPCVLVLDLALQSGRGEEVLAQLARSGRAPQTVVFSAYTASSELERSSVVAMVEKPDFVHLEQVLYDLREGELPGNRRRPQREPTDLPPRGPTTGGGFETWQSFVDAVAQLAPDDALLALELVPDVDGSGAWDHVHRLDHLVALGRLAGRDRRNLERVTLTPAGVPVLIVVGGLADAPAAVFERLQKAWADDAPGDTAPGVLVGAFGLVSDDWPPLQLLELVLEAVRDGVEPGSPLRMV